MITVVLYTAEPHCTVRLEVAGVLPSALRNGSESLMALHLVNDLLKMERGHSCGNVTDSLGPNEEIKRLKVKDVTAFVCVSFFDVCQRL